MRRVGTDELDARRDIHGARAIVLGFLVALLAGRAVDAVNHGEFWYVLFVVALFVLPMWFASGVARPLWTRLRWWLLSAQAVLTYVPFALFGSGWVGGISGLLAGLVLLTVSAPASWAVFVVLMGVEELIWLGVVGPPYTPVVHAAIWLLIAFADNGLALFGLTWIAELVREVASTRDELAVAAITRQRLAVAERLRSMIGDRVRTVTARATAARDALADRPDVARTEIASAGVTAREMLAEARAMTGDPDERITTTPQPGVRLAPKVATGVLLVVLVLFAAQNLANVVLSGVGYPPSAVAVALVAGIAIPVLQLRHSGLRGRPKAWPWTFVAQAVLTYVQFLFVGSVGLAFVGFLAGSALLLFRGRSRWVWFGVIVASVPGLVLLAPGEPWTVALVRWTGYATATAVAFGLLVYGLARLTNLAVRLAALREELAELAAVRERLRLARDTHDLLGLGLSAIALKTDLIAALIGRDDDRVRHELDELLWLCHKAGNDARLVAAESLRLSFASELGLAFDILTSSGISVLLPDRPPPTQQEIDREVDVVLATVVREAVTNILRHSEAEQCTIALAVDDDVLRLRIGNDGVLAGDGCPGKGLANLRARVEVVEGRFTARRTLSEFEIVAELPYRR
ncbi:sensor histidine kinase [Actinophytocola sp. NPDC049390]|uniref:sensor histidine kinase n=1 Tax=Actinophytocola sp. NPDC049390 TaxID=3363894 RepID=UPI0037991A8C